MRDELVERMARAIADSDRAGGFAIDMARACLSEIEAMGMVVVPRPVELTPDLLKEVVRQAVKNVNENLVPNSAFRAAAPKPDGE